MWDCVEKVVIGILFIWVCLAAHQIVIYEEHVYDCSNMVADQEQFFSGLGIDTKIGVRYQTEEKCGHIWLILPFNIPFECTALCVQPFNNNPDDVFDSVDQLVNSHPEYEPDFV